MKRILLLIYLFCGKFTFSQYQKIPSVHALEDLKLIREVIFSYHPSPFRYISKNEWDTKYNSIKQQIVRADSLSKIQFLRRTKVLTNLIKDEHIRFYLDDKEWSEVFYKELFFPLKLKQSKDPDALVIDKAFVPKLSHLVGLQITEINDFSVSEIIAEAKNSWHPSSSKDALGTLYHVFNHNNFSRFFKLYLDTAQTFDITFIDQETKTISGIHLPKEDEFPEANKYNFETKPEFLIDKNRSYAYLKSNSFMPNSYGWTSRKSYKKLRRFFIQISRLDIQKLTIDLRGNLGGLASFSADFVSFFHSDSFQLFDIIYSRKNVLNDFPDKFIGIGKTSLVQNDSIVIFTELLNDFSSEMKGSYKFKGETSILIDGGTGSAATMFVANMKAYNLATIYGNESIGDCCATSGARWQDFTLENSGITISIPLIMFVHDNVEETKSGVIPDIKSIDKKLLPVSVIH